MLATYAGTVILISHDRDFLDRVVNLVLAPDGDGRWIEYAGGYSDMLAQRGADLASRAVPQKSTAGPVAKTAPAPAAQPAKRKLSFHEKHALETLPTEIAAVQARIRTLHAQLDDPTLYGRDPTAFTEATEALASAELRLAAAEEKWLELEILREEIAGN
jgi:ABC transport system ATP-binding/permease protein